jgi:site-specific DNA-methyltransferase (adenine-specific)
MAQREIEHLIVDIDSVQPHEKNVRQGDIGAISESLKAHGQYRPIVVDRRTNRILAGNHTWKAAKALGWQQIAAGYVETKDDDEALRILLADNRTTDLASYDDSGLAELLKQLSDTDIGLEGTAFDGDDLDALLKDLGHFELPADVDEIPEDVPAISKLGDLWLCGEHRVLCGNSSDLQTINNLINSQKINMIFTDPPYGMDLDTDFSKMGNTGKSHRKVANDDKQFDATIILEQFAYCKEIFLWGADYYVERLNRQYPDLGSWIIWDKYSDERIGLLDGRFGSSFETCWSKTKHKREIARVLVTTNYTARGDETRVHPTQKPVALGKWFFDRWGNEGDIVLDLFGGSGSTLIAAQETNRIAYLMELDPHYVDVICARYQKHTGNQPILEATGEPHNFL